MDVALLNDEKLLASVASCLVWIGNVYSDGKVSVVAGEVWSYGADGVTIEELREMVPLE